MNKGVDLNRIYLADFGNAHALVFFFQGSDWRVREYTLCDDGVLHSSSTSIEWKSYLKEL